MWKAKMDDRLLVCNNVILMQDMQALVLTIGDVLSITFLVTNLNKICCFY